MRPTRTTLENTLRIYVNQRYWAGIGFMQELCDAIVDEGVKNPRPEIDDLTNMMLNTEDPDTHTKLSKLKKNTKWQHFLYVYYLPLERMLTLQIAGHETTSGTLEFVICHLLSNPNTYHKAHQEGDNILENDAISYQHLSKLTYLEACIKEALRYEGPLTTLARRAKRPTTLAGKYDIDTDTDLVCPLKKIHRDPAVWGPDADTFRPEQTKMFDPVSGLRVPFGIGMRSCIGRISTEQEMPRCLALMLQKFQIELANSNHMIGLKSTLTSPPAGPEIKVRRQHGQIRDGRTTESRIGA